jgi:hypothetical protein
VIVVFTLSLVFNHWTRRPRGESAVSYAVREGAVAVDVPDDGAGGSASGGPDQTGQPDQTGRADQTGRDEQART